MYTKGSLLAGRLDAAKPERSGPVFDAHGTEFYGECRAHGVRPKITARMVEAWGEAEYAARTEGNFAGLSTCETCHERISVMGGCACGNLTAEQRMEAAVFGTVTEPATTDTGPKLIRPEQPESLRRRPIATPEAPMPSSALLPDLPDDATPEQVAEWRAQYVAMREARDALLATCHREYKSPLDDD